ncbi:unnamed protein product [Cylindrotheca closterium]|uniref:Transmembrane 9 superfamily member n=1 Tax=Cylindrotheca closterium TaxID=2856 RepID=A0AAD2FRU9_9STRA|nr:unnamed protein product [Cylindrotheca closterium]
MREVLHSVKETLNNGTVLVFLLLSALLAMAGQSETRLFGQYLSRPNHYADGANIPVWILPMTSFDSQVSLPYDESLFCTTTNKNNDNDNDNDNDNNDNNKATPPSRWIVDSNPTLPSSIQVRNEYESSNQKYPLCQKTLSEDRARALQNLIEKRYRHNIAIDDGLPAACTFVVGSGDFDIDTKTYHGGCPIGYKDYDGSFYIYNHLRLIVRVNSYGHVVHFDIQPKSIRGKEEWWDQVPAQVHHHGQNHGQNHGEELVANELSDYNLTVGKTKSARTTEPAKVTANETIYFSYQVEMMTSDLRWSHRWNVYLTENHLVPPQVHIYSITNSLLMVVFLGALMVNLWIKRLNMTAKLSHHQHQPLLPKSADDDDEEEGVHSSTVVGFCSCCKKNKADAQKWRLLHGDIFRPTSTYPMLLVVLTGTGAQILSSILVLCPLCILGIVSPIYKRTLLVGALGAYSLVGSWVGGYVTAQSCQALQLSKDKEARARASFLTSALFPSLLSIVHIGINSWSIRMNSPSTRPLFPDVLMVMLAMGVFVYQSYRGAEYGFANPMTPFPTATSDTIRDIPIEPNVWKRWWFRVLPYVGNALILFGIFYVENFFLMRYFWYGQFFDAYGYLTIVLVLMVTSSAAISVIWTYMQLNQENHSSWWWTSFAGGASSGLSFLWYYWSTMHTFTGGGDEGHIIPVGAAVYYHVVTSLVAIGIALSSGFVSFASSLFFNRSLYGSLSDGE